MAGAGVLNGAAVDAESTDDPGILLVKAAAAAAAVAVVVGVVVIVIVGLLLELAAEALLRRNGENLFETGPREVIGDEDPESVSGVCGSEFRGAC